MYVDIEGMITIPLVDRPIERVESSYHSFLERLLSKEFLDENIPVLPEKMFCDQRCISERECHELAYILLRYFGIDVLHLVVCLARKF